MFSYDIELKTGDSHSIFDLNTNSRINFGKSIKLGNHVWVGAHVVILKGVEIGDNSVIGTSTVCTKSIPACSLAVGIPANVIKTNVTWERKRIEIKNIAKKTL